MAETYLRRAQLQDLPAIMKIIDDAKELLKKNGSPQWQNGYPNQETLTQDIAMQTNWVLINDNKVAATATLQLTPEPTYRNITQGQWQQPDEPYATIHRVAISSNYRGQGLSKLLFSNLLTVGKELRIFGLILTAAIKRCSILPKILTLRSKESLKLMTKMIPSD